MRRVAITGLGVFCACGKNTSGFWESLANGRPGISKLESFPQLRFGNAAWISDYAPEAWLNSRDIDLLDRFAQFGILAARQAVADANIEWDTPLRENTGVITGSCVGGKSTEDANFRGLYSENQTRFHPMIVPRTMANAAASAISMEFGVTGPSFTFSTACSSASHAIAQAFWMVRQGTLEMAITGGSEAPFSLGHLKAWEGLRVVSPDTCRPFSKDRKGLILGEGAAMLVIEPLDRALARGARIYAEIVGAGMNADAHHITQPSADGASRAMRLALKDASLDPGAIGYINAHGTGTQANDFAESQAIRQLFDNVAVSSTKSMHGHALGAAGALEAAATALALQNGVLPPTANFTQPDPACDIDVIANHARPRQVEYALSNSFAFGGLNAVIALRTHN